MGGGQHDWGGSSGPKDITRSFQGWAREAIPGGSGLPKAARGRQSTKNRASSPTCPSTAKPPATCISYSTSFNPPLPWEAGINIPTSKKRK